MTPAYERTAYGYRITTIGGLLPHEAQRALDALRRLVDTDSPGGFAVLLDARGLTGCSSWTSAILAETLTWLGKRGMTRSAVVFDHPTTFLHLRSVAKSAAVYETQRYFSTRIAWEREAADWVERGAETTPRHAEYLTELGVLLDGLAEGAMLCALDGTVLYRNAALERILLLDEERDEIQRSICTWFVQPPSETIAIVPERAPSVNREAMMVRTSSQSYRVRSTSMSCGWLGTSAGVLVTVEPVAPAPLDDGMIQARFGLTNREIAVARLVAVGKTNAEIAEVLQISAFTARNHVERILAKLGVPNRTSVSALLLSDSGREIPSMSESGIPVPFSVQAAKKGVRFTPSAQSRSWS